MRRSLAKMRIGEAIELPSVRRVRSGRTGVRPRIAVASGEMGSDPTPWLGVLISGRGSNLAALIGAIQAGTLRARIAVVISNRHDATGLEHARAAGIEAVILEHQRFPTRDDFDRAVARELQTRGVSLVCLAGFMRLIGAPLLEAFPNAILNIHPSLLPSFPGVDAQRQALDHGVRITGATVHLVTGELDGGPIVLQAAVPVQDGDSADTLAARILAQEHRLYPEAVAMMLRGRWRIEGRRFVREDGAVAAIARLP